MPEQTNDKINKNPLKGLFNYQWIVKNIPFFLFLSVLTIAYIANGHNADKTIRKINSTTNELKELQFEYKTLKSEVMFKSEEKQIVKAAEPLGLKISTESPKRIAGNQ
jgi:cell division protein FtsL